MHSLLLIYDDTFKTIYDNMNYSKQKHIKVLRNHILNIFWVICVTRYSHYFQQESEQPILGHILYLSHCMCKQHNTAFEKYTCSQASRCRNDR